MRLHRLLVTINNQPYTIVKSIEVASDFFSSAKTAVCYFKTAVLQSRLRCVGVRQPMNQLATNFPKCFPAALLGLIVLLLAGCQTAAPLPTRADLAPTVDLLVHTSTPAALAAVPPTWTAVPPDAHLNTPAPVTEPRL